MLRYDNKFLAGSKRIFSYNHKLRKTRFPCTSGDNRGCLSEHIGVSPLT